MPSLVVAAAHILCYVNGQLFGNVDSFKWSSATPHRAIHGIDSVDAFEQAVTTTKVSGVLQLYRLTGDGGAQGRGMAPSYADLPRQKYYTLQLVDRRSDLVLFECADCSTDLEEWAVVAKGLLRGTVNFVGIIWGNEATQQ